MGHSRIVNYKCIIYLSDGTKMEIGQDNFSKIHTQSKSAVEQTSNAKYVMTVVWPQTKRAENTIQKDFAIINCTGKVDRYNCGDPIPFYEF